jgi:ubiquinone/menaquinone biosynthesis C-methylase UbiE
MEAPRSYAAKYNRSNNEIALSGVIRSASEAELAPLRELFRTTSADVSGVLYVNCKRLTHLDHAGTRELAKLIRDLVHSRDDVRVELVVSTIVPWAMTRFAAFAESIPRVTVKCYDLDFYPGQSAIENDQLIPVLRTQTQLVWPLERPILAGLGIDATTKVADVCCGIGDFALLLRKEFAPAQIVAIDHSQRFLSYAAAVANEFGLDRIEYRVGDASDLHVPDDSFDLVTSRLALQIFDKPENIVSELFRICKPGGRVYITNEIMSHNLGYPQQESISTTFRAIAALCKNLGIDMDFGPKVVAHLRDRGFVDIEIKRIEVNNTATDVEEFVSVIDSWVDYVTGELSTATGQPPDEIERLRAGLGDFIAAIRHKRGFASWPLYVASARKPTAARH